MTQRLKARSVRSRAAVPRYVVIMAGGHGTRFWPRSRRRVPKQLLSIAGRHTMLQETVRRLLPLVSWQRMLVVTNAEHADEVRRQLPHLGPDQVLVEPVGRNTLPCVVLAAEWIAARVPDALMIVVPADHVIKDAVALRRALSAACSLAARRDCLVTLGVQPTRPDPGYGYVEVGRSVDGGSAAAHWVRRFHEKPTAVVAKRYVASRRYLWNSGMFVWKASVFRQAVERCAPEVQRALRGIWAHPAAASARRLARVYRALPSVSVDVAVMQPITARPVVDGLRVAVLPAAFDWNDVGSWVAMPEVWGCDPAGNAAIGRLLALETSDSIVYSPERLIALVGVKDLIVVDSHDALLICARDRAQDVRKVTHIIEERGWSRYL